MVLVSIFGDKNKSLQDCSPKSYFGILKAIYCLPKILSKKEKLEVCKEQKNGLEDGCYFNSLHKI